MYPFVWRFVGGCGQVVGCDRQSHLDKSRRGSGASCTMQPTCSQGGFSKRATCGLKGDKALFCAGHAEEGMLDLINKKCANQGCSKHLAFRRRWNQEASVLHGTCERRNDGCLPQELRTTGLQQAAEVWRRGNQKLGFCAGHARGGMVDLIHKKCAQPGCSTEPSFGVS